MPSLRSWRMVTAVASRLGGVAWQGRWRLLGVPLGCPLAAACSVVASDGAATPTLTAT